MKTKRDKKVVHLMKVLNRQLRQDVYGDRFYVRMTGKFGYVDCHEYHWYRFELMDNECPERNEIIYLSEGEVLISYKLYKDMNDFIVTSDFWEKFDKQVYFKTHCLCSKCNRYTEFKTKRERITRWLSDGTKVSFIGYQDYCKHCGSVAFPMSEETQKKNLDIVKKDYPNAETLYLYDVSKLLREMNK